MTNVHSSTSGFFVAIENEGARERKRHAHFPGFFINLKALAAGNTSFLFPSLQTRESRGIDRFCYYPCVYCVILSCARRTQSNGKCKIHQICQCNAYVYSKRIDHMSRSRVRKREGTAAEGRTEGQTPAGWAGKMQRQILGTYHGPTIHPTLS